MGGGNAPAVRQVLAGILGRLQEYERDLASDEPIAALTDRLRVPSELRRAWPPRPDVAIEVPAEPGALLALGRAGGWVTAVREDRLEAMRPETDRNRS
jgi:prephenate dehydrogenase